MNKLIYLQSFTVIRGGIKLYLQIQPEGRKETFCFEFRALPLKQMTESYSDGTFCFSVYFKKIGSFLNIDSLVSTGGKKNMTFKNSDLNFVSHLYLQKRLTTRRPNLASLSCLCSLLLLFTQCIFVRQHDHSSTQCLP